MITAHGREAAVVNCRLPACEVALILRVGVAKAADGRDAHAVKVGTGFGGVTLKIAMERALFLRDGEFVAGFGEMIHADVAVAGFDELQEAGAKDFELFHAFRQKHSECALLLFEPRNVCVAEKGNAIGVKRNDLLDSGGKTSGVLMR